MNDDFAEIDERIAFCAAETETYSKEAKSFLDSAFTMRRTHSLFGNGQKTDVYATMRKPVPVAIRSRAGVIANELRSCLDNLACNLAKRNGHTDVGGVYFPVSKSKDIFDVDGIKKIRKLSDSDIQKIIDLKPYRGGHPHLFKLHEADRTRKHQKLAACTVNNAQMNLGNMFVVQGGAELTFENIALDGVYVDRFTLGSNNIQLQEVGREVAVLRNIPLGLNLHIFFGLSYSEPEDLAKLDVYQTLLKFRESVQAVINSFK
jgi:hypothetical protein